MWMGLTLGVLSVGDGITDDTLEEGLQNTAGLLVDHGRDTLDTTTTRQTADGRLCDTLDVVTKNLKGSQQCCDEIEWRQHTLRCLLAPPLPRPLPPFPPAKC